MSRCSRETRPDVPEWWEAILDVRLLSGGPPGCLGGVERHSQMFGRPSRMFGSGREALSDVRECWEDLPNVQKWLGNPPGCPGVVG